MTSRVFIIDLTHIKSKNCQQIMSCEFIKKNGGISANAAGAMAKLEVEVDFIGVVGNDPFGNF